MIFISDRDKKCMDTVFLVIDDQIGEDDGMISENTQITDPPFGTSCTVTVYDETLWWGIICGSCHQTLDIRSMTELSLCIASKNLSFESWLKEHLFLFFRAKVVQSGHEHVKVEGQGHLFTEEQLLSLFEVIIEGENLMVPQELLGVE